MKRGIRVDVPQAVVALRKRIAAWRGDKQGRRMPEELWAEAIALAGKYGVHPVSRNVEVSYTRLKKLVAAGKQRSSEIAPKFIDVSSSQWRRNGGVRIEIRRPDGCELVIEDADVVCASEVAAGFLGRLR